MCGIIPIEEGTMCGILGKQLELTVDELLPKARMMGQQDLVHVASSRDMAWYFMK